MIDNFIQPKNIVVADDLQLVKYYPRYKQTLEWYQDLGVCKQVDNIDFPYDIARLKAMYNTLSKKESAIISSSKTTADGVSWEIYHSLAAI